MDEAAQVIARLTAVGRTLVTAESCTGGLLGKLLTDVPVLPPSISAALSPTPTP